jgi:hypothetical protein
MMFPSGWPEGCPPADAVAATGRVYRVVRTDPPVASDFLSLLEQGRPIADRPCESAGLSIFRAFQDAVHYAEKYPHIGEMVAEGQLEPRHGVLKLTPRRSNSHATWWPADGIARHAAFSIVQS